MYVNTYQYVNQYSDQYVYQYVDQYIFQYRDQYINGCFNDLV